MALARIAIGVRVDSDPDELAAHDRAQRDAAVGAETRSMVAGDPAALAVVFDRYYALVLGECRRRLGPQSPLIEDATQEAWLRVARRPVLCHSEGQLLAWLRAVAMSASIDLLRSELARRSRERAKSLGVGERALESAIRRAKSRARALLEETR